MTSSARTVRAAVAAALGTMVVASAAPATGSTREVADPDDTRGRLDVVSAGHGHTADGDLRHTLRMQQRWPSSLLADGEIALVFRQGSRYRTLQIGYRRDRLVGEICTTRVAGADVERRCSRQVGLSRPDPRTLEVTLAEPLVGRDRPSYRWQAVTLLDSGEGDCPEVVCADQAPDDGRWVRHRVGPAAVPPPTPFPGP